MDRAAADALLADVELVPAVEGSVAAARELERRLLANEIPVMLATPDACCGSGGCAPKLQVLLREEDVPRLGQLLKDEWLEALAREGLGDGLMALGTPSSGEALACPACGFAGPLVEGACGDCGLQLE
jgi:hypothetical protein